MSYVLMFNRHVPKIVHSDGTYSYEDDPESLFMTAPNRYRRMLPQEGIARTGAEHKRALAEAQAAIIAKQKQEFPHINPCGLWYDLGDNEEKLAWSERLL